MQNNSYMKAAVAVTLITVISKIFGFTREILLASHFGTSVALDIFLVVSTLPIVIFNLVGQGISQSFLPVYLSSKKENDTGGQNRFISDAIKFMLLAGAVIAALCCVLADPIIQIMVPGFVGDEHKIAVEYFRLFTIIILSLSLEGIFQGVLQGNGILLPPAFANITYNVILIVPMLILKNRLQVEALCYILIAAYFGRMLTNAVFLYKTPFRFIRAMGEDRSLLKQLIRLMPPILVSYALLEINFVVDKAVASTLAEGAVSVVNYAEKVITIISSTVFCAITFVFFPKITKLYNTDEDAFKKYCNKVIQLLLPVAVWISAVCFFKSKDIVTVLFKGGAFDDISVARTSAALRGYSFGFFMLVYRDLIKRVWHAQQNTRVSLAGTAVNCIIKVILVVLLARKYGEVMLTVTTTVAMGFELLYYLFITGKKARVFRIKQFVLNALYVSIAFGCIGFLIRNVDLSLPYGERVSALLSLSVWCVLFLALAAVSMIPVCLFKNNRALMQN